jgi:hypothetical protein
VSLISASAQITTNQDTFILSNEGPGYLITKLVNAGYGGFNLYQTLIQIQQNTDPSVAGIITDDFLAALATNPASNEIFSTPLNHWNTPGTAVAISTDGTAQTNSVFGATYYGQSGTATLASKISEVDTGSFTYSTSSSPLTSWTTTVGGTTTTYNVFAVGWGGASALTIVKETAKLNFAKTNADSCAFTGTLALETGLSLTNAAVTVEVGGADASFTLDAKGKGRGVSTNGTCKLSYKKKTKLWTFTAKLKSGSWATQWETYGLSNVTTTAKAGVPVTLPVTLVIGDEGFYGEKTLHYKAKAGKSGSAK